MKLRKLKGTVYNACDRVCNFPFISRYLQHNSIPNKGKWVIDMKNNLAFDEKNKFIKLTFTELFHKWFLREIKNADTKLYEIDSAVIIFNFDLNNKKRPAFVSCIIQVGDKKYDSEKDIELW